MQMEKGFGRRGYFARFTCCLGIIGEEVAEDDGAYKVTEGLWNRLSDKRVVGTPISSVQRLSVTLHADHEHQRRKERNLPCVRQYVARSVAL